MIINHIDDLEAFTCLRRDQTLCMMTGNQCQLSKMHNLKFWCMDIVILLWANRDSPQQSSITDQYEISCLIHFILFPDYKIQIYLFNTLDF